MLKQFFLILFIILGLEQSLLAQENLIRRQVSVFEDFEGGGTLRTIIRLACTQEGNDQITFLEPRNNHPIHIELFHPLVIPEDCKGSLHIIGRDERDVILDGGQIQFEDDPRPWSVCSLNIYSDQHTIQKLSFIGNQNGAGVCHFGKSIQIENNKFGFSQAGIISPNLYAIVFSNHFIPNFELQNEVLILKNNIIRDQSAIWSNRSFLQIMNNAISEADRNALQIFSDQNKIIENQIFNNKGDGLYLDSDFSLILENEIFSNGGDGIKIKGESNHIEGNLILANGGCPEEVLFLSQNQDCYAGENLNGTGIRLMPISKNNLIGKLDFSINKENLIQFNKDGGFIIMPHPESRSNLISQNIISKNYGLRPDIDLNNDGITLNDERDLDEGPNDLLNTIETLFAVELVPDLNGLERYYIWGPANQGDRIEFYKISEEDIERGKTHGGGNQFLYTQMIDDEPIRLLLSEENNIFINTYITSLKINFDNNTSEYAARFKLAEDDDFDGLLNEVELGIEESSSSSQNKDSDGDGLDDTIEDKNRNGFWDQEENETASFKSDSDEDGLSDWIETHGDGHYNPIQDSNPLMADTDGDGLLDGEEDHNQNGIWEVYLGETNPRLFDSDGDGFSDSEDVCPNFFDVNQNPRHCRN